MAYRSNNSGCGCIIVFIVVMAIISGIRGCTERLINGDLKLPKLGSSHVSGGSGGYGTSNGYNVQYNKTIRPSKNNSLMDYTDTNNQPTEYSEGRSENNTNISSSTSTNISMPQNNTPSTKLNNTTITPSQRDIDNENVLSLLKIKYVTCPDCNGDGHVLETWTFTGESGNPCVICWKVGRHEHINEPILCARCMGRGKIIVDENE